MDDQTRAVFVADGEIQAQQVRAFLKAWGISSSMRGETLGKIYGLTLDGLGAAEIFVSATDEDRAKTLLASAEAGEFRLNRSKKE
jgi:Putative prokaryotic signal transducing protein